MYKLIYPENGKEIVPLEFIWVKDAMDYWRTKHGGLWVEIEPQHPDDVAAFMQTLTGEIVIIRRFGAGMEE